jgi:hypothetical protein
MLLVLPDQVTAYGTDDGASGLITRFVANTAGDLSSGILYASKVIPIQLYQTLMHDIPNNSNPNLH